MTDKLNCYGWFYLNLGDYEDHPHWIPGFVSTLSRGLVFETIINDDRLEKGRDYYHYFFGGQIK